MGEGGGFPRVQAVLSQVSPELPVVATLALGSQPRQSAYKGVSQEEAQEPRQRHCKGAGQEEAGSHITYSREC